MSLVASAPWRDPSNVIVVQYWRSVEGTRQVRQGASLTHAPAWAAFNRDAAGTGDIGIWHETYRVPADLVETLYGKLARLGFGKGLGVRESFGAPRNSTHQKMGATDADQD